MSGNITVSQESGYAPSLYCGLIAALAVLTVLVPPSQRAAGDEPAQPRRSLDIEVLIQSQPSYRIKSQEWGESFRNWDTMSGSVNSAQVRPPVWKILIATMSGSPTWWRPWRLVGRFESAEQFDIDNTPPLTLALEKLQRHGSERATRAARTWGLTDDQFKEVTRLLGVPCENAIELQSSILRLSN
ncbi:MAG: hypothetical protein R3C17_22090 [Planctomycetaceae bacterium]